MVQILKTHLHTVHILKTHVNKKSDHDESAGMHWLTILTDRCPKDIVNIYNSAGGFIISTSVEKSIANILQSDGYFITVYSVNCDC